MQVSPPVRSTHSFVQRLTGPSHEVFPLLCPVLEKEWAKGWDPLVVISRSGVAERDCVFTTRDDGREATWIVTEHDPVSHQVEMLKVIPGFTVTRLRIGLRPAGPERCEADVTYTWTALSREGESFVAGRTEQAWATFMREWEDELNTYLRAR